METRIAHNRHPIVDGKIKCVHCREYKVPDAFHNSQKNHWRFGKAYLCKPCAITASRNNHRFRKDNDPLYQRKKRNGWIKKAWGIALQEYEERLAQQDFKCAICGVELPTSGHKTHLDHCHKTGNLRAFLCTNCNRGLGHFKDSPEILRKAIDYLMPKEVSQ